MLNIIDALYAFVIIWVVLAASWGVGHLLQLCLQKIGYTANLHVFEKFFIGLLLLISIGAIITCKFITILLPVPLLLVWYARTRKSDSVPALSAQQIILFSITSSGFVFLFYFFALYTFDTESIKYVSGDFNIYIRTAEQLNRTGIESNRLNPVYFSTRPAPYHYGDVWLFAAVSRLFSHNPSIIFLVSNSILYVIFSIGIFTYLHKKFRKYIPGKSIVLYLVAFSGLFSGFAVFFPSFFLLADIYTASILNYPKVLLPACFFIWTLMTAQDEDWKSLSLIIGISALAFINTAPAFYIATFLILIVNAVAGKIKWRTFIVCNALSLLITGLSFFTLYKIIPDFLLPADQSVTPADIPLPPLQPISYVIAAIKIAIGGVLQLSTALPYILLLFAGLFVVRKNIHIRSLLHGKSPDIIFLLCILLSSLICWAVLHPVTVDAIQFYVNILYIFYAVVISLILVWIIYVVKNKMLITVAVTCTLIAAVTNSVYTFSIASVHSEDWQRLRDYMQDKTSFSFANIRPQSSFRSLFDKNTEGFIPLTMLSYLSTEYYNISLNTPFIPVNEDSYYKHEERKLIANAPFTTYSRTHNNNDTGNLMLSFVTTNNIEHISVHGDTVLPVPLRTYVTDSLALPHSGIVLYTLKY